MALAIAEQQPTCLRKRHAMAQGGQRILQHTAALHVHVYVTAGHGGETLHFGQGQALCQYLGIVAVAVQLHGQPGMREGLADPAGPFQQGMTGCIGRLSVGVLIRQPQAEQAVARSPFHIRPGQHVSSLGGCTAAGGDQRTEVFVALLVLHQQHEARAIGQPELAADDQWHARVAAGLEGPHDAGQ